MHKLGHARGWFARTQAAPYTFSTGGGRRRPTATPPPGCPGGLELFAIRLRSVVTLLGRYPALAGVDLDVAEGEVVLLSGPNGAGKSTLLRLLAGLLPVTGGEAHVLGRDLAVDRRSHRGEVGYLGHESLCYDDLTVRENLRFQARAAGRHAGARAVADGALEQVELSRVADVPFRLLSAGQRRRLSLGMVLARDARLLLLDEPHAGLDAGGRALLDRLVRHAPAEGRTVVMASHELDLARAVADREVAIAGGRAAGGLLDSAEEDGAEDAAGTPGTVMAR